MQDSEGGKSGKVKPVHHPAGLLKRLHDPSLKTKHISEC